MHPGHPDERAPKHVWERPPKKAERGHRTIHFTINGSKIFSPKYAPPEQWPTPHVRPPGLYAGWVIALMQYCAPGEKAMAQSKIKGALPSHAPYMLYTCVCKEGQDRGKTYFQVVKVLSCARLQLDRTTLAWVLRYEVGYTAQQVARAMLPYGRATRQRPRTDAGISDGDLSPALRAVLAARSLYMQRSGAEDTLKRWFPQSALLVAAQLGNGLAAPDSALRTLLRDAPWRLAFEPVSAAHGFPEPLQAAHLRAVLSEADLAQCQDAPLRARVASYCRAHPHGVRLISDAVDCYDYLVHYCKKRGHTVFHAHNVLPLWHQRAPWSAFQFLVDVVGGEAVVSYRVAGRTVYSLAAHHADMQCILEAMRGVWDRHRRHAAAAPALPALPPGARGEDRQARAMAAAEREPFLLLAGPPGTGKTYVLERLVARQQALAKDSCALCTLTGTMAAGHRERGLALSTTIHRPLTDLLTAERGVARERVKIERNPADADAALRYEKAVKQLEAVCERFAAVEWLLIDEFSNVDLHLFRRVLVLFPNLRKLVLIYDEWQTPPIDAGRPCLELAKALKAYTVTLEKNMRVCGTAAHALVENDRNLLRLRFDALAFECMEAGAPAAALRLGALPAMDADGVRPGCYLIAPSGDGLPADVHWICENLCPNVDRRQILSLTHNLRVKVNVIVDCQQGGAGARAREGGDGEGGAGTRTAQGWSIYSGQRLAVCGRNFPAVPKVDLARAAGLPSPTTQTRKPQRKGNAQAAAEFRSDAVNNHEVFVFDYYQDYNLQEQRWNSHRLRQTTHVALGRVPVGMVRFMRTRCGRQFCIHDKYLQPEKLDAAWGGTVNSFQGRQEDAIVFVLPEDPFSFDIHHLHVACSRSRMALILLGTMEQLKALALNQVTPRQSVLGQQLGKAVAGWKRTENIPRGFLDMFRK